MEKTTEKIIEFVRKNPDLWDKTHRDYKNQATRNKKWSQLATRLGLRMDVVKKRWKTIRDRHYRTLKKNDKYSKYKYGDMLHFLPYNNKCETSIFYFQNNNEDCEEAAATTNGKIMTNVDGIISEEGIINENDEQCEDFECIKIETDNTCNHTKCEFSDTSDISEPPYSPLNDATTKTSLSKIEANDLEIQERTLDALNICKELIQSRDTKSPIKLFMLSLASQIEMANLSGKSLLQLQIKLLKLVDEEINKECK